MNKGKNNLVVQASILAIAGIVSRIIGLLYRGPLHGVIGDLGLGYYQSAYTYYTIVLLISSYSIPSAISKVISQKIALNEYRNAHQLFQCAFVYVLLIGGIGSIFLFFGAGLFVDDAAIPVLRVFAPTILIYGMLGVLRGYFQAYNSMIQTSISQIIEQIINAIFSVGTAYFMISSVMGTLDMPADTDVQNTRAIWGAMGSAVGTGMGVLFALFFMLFAYGTIRKKIRTQVAQDVAQHKDSYKHTFKLIVFTVTPFILSTAIYNLSSSVNTKIFTEFYPNLKGLDSIDITSIWGRFSGQALTISNIPVAFASAMAAAMLPSIATSITVNRMDEAKEKIGSAVKTTMFISIPCAIGMFALAEPIINLLFTNTIDVLSSTGKMLMALSISVIFYGLSTLNSSILQGIGKVNTPIINASIALVLQTAIAFVLLIFTDLGIYSIILANIVYSGSMCILNQRAVRKAIGYEQEYRKTFIIPVCASVVMGVIIKLMYQGLYQCLDNMKLAVIPAILFGILIYFFMLILLKGVTEEEIEKLPKGKAILKLLKKCRKHK